MWDWVCVWLLFFSLSSDISTLQEDDYCRDSLMSTSKKKIDYWLTDRLEEQEDRQLIDWLTRRAKRSTINWLTDSKSKKIDNWLIDWLEKQEDRQLTVWLTRKTKRSTIEMLIEFSTSHHDWLTDFERDLHWVVSLIWRCCM